MDLREFRGILILVPAWRAPSPEGPFTPPHPQSPKFLRETSLEPQIPEGNFSGPPNPRGKFPGAPNSKGKLPWNPKFQRETSPTLQIPEGNFPRTPNSRGKNFPGTPNSRGKIPWSPKSQRETLCCALQNPGNKTKQSSRGFHRPFWPLFSFLFFFWSCF